MNREQRRAMKKFRASPQTQRSADLPVGQGFGAKFAEQCRSISCAAVGLDLDVDGNPLILGAGADPSVAYEVCPLVERFTMAIQALATGPFDAFFREWTADRAAEACDAFAAYRAAFVELKAAIDRAKAGSGSAASAAH
jgi:hypothetical protein